MPQNPVNYARMQRIEASNADPPSRWSMTPATKVCVGIMALGALILYRRWVLKRTPKRPLVDEPFQF